MSYKLSKSTYIRGLQCEKSLYLHKKHSELRNEISDHQQAIFSQGTSVGELAQDLFPGGVDCSFEDVNEIPQCIKDTARHIAQGTPIIYEAAFEYNDVAVFADILVNDEDGWKVYEVKSSTKVKPEYVKDAALQTYVIRNAGIDIVDTFVVHVNVKYVRQGALDLDQLFTKVSIKDRLDELLQEIPPNLDRLKLVLASDAIPDVAIGAHCSNPYPCDFSNVCWINVPEQSVFDVRGMHLKKKIQLYEDGVEQLVDIPDNFQMSDKQRMQVSGEQSGASNVEVEAIQEFTKQLNYPLYYLDFETVNPAVPQHDGVKPYQQLPFQYSLHIQQEKGGECVHKEYLAETDGTDPRIEFVKQLIDDCGGEGDVIVYNASFEKGVLSALSKVFTKEAKQIEAIKERMVDLIIPFRKGWYYTPEMNGSYSIKAVLPALVPELTYEDLEIGDGASASGLYREMALGEYEGDHDQLRTDLLAYCKMDTWAMVKILEVLEQLKK